MEKKKRTWVAPRLTVYGSVAAITQLAPCDKDTGGSDGFTFQGTPIKCVGPVKS